MPQSLPFSRTPANAGIALGPILFLIAILAIIAAAVAAGSGSFNASTATESDKLTATTILQTASSLQEAVQKVASHGCADAQINFNNPIISGYTNPNAPGDGSCDVFSANGGSISFPQVKASTLETLDNGYFSINGNSEQQGIGCYDTTNSGACNKITAFLPIDSATLCQAINTLLKYPPTMTGTGMYTIASDTNGHWIGAYGTNSFNIVTQGPLRATPQVEACVATQTSGRAGFQGPLNAPYFFYAILLLTR